MSDRFKITQGKGFTLPLPNGWSVSVQFGPGNYGDNYHMSARNGAIEAGSRGSSTAEVAAFNPQDEMIALINPSRPERESDLVHGYLTPAEVYAFIQHVAAQPA